MSRAHAPGRTFYSFPDAEPWEARGWWSVDGCSEVAAWPTGLDLGRLVAHLDLGQYMAPSLEWFITQHGLNHFERWYEERIAIQSRSLRVAGDVESAVTQDTIDALLDLARSGQESDFRALAAMTGVRGEDADALWTGTVRRLAPSTVGRPR